MFIIRKLFLKTEQGYSIVTSESVVSIFHLIFRSIKQLIKNTSYLTYIQKKPSGTFSAIISVSSTLTTDDQKDEPKTL